MVDPPGFDHDQSTAKDDWIRNVESLEKDRVATESYEEVSNYIDLLNRDNYENYMFEYIKKFNVNLYKWVSISRNG